jgi:hypothetical protein
MGVGKQVVLSFDYHGGEVIPANQRYGGQDA